MNDIRFIIKKYKKVDQFLEQSEGLSLKAVVE